MFGYIVHRLFVMIPTLLVISALVFIIIQLPPGDYLTTMINELRAQGEAGQDKIAFLRKEYGLDQPMVVQYLTWVGLWPTEVNGEYVFNGMLQGYFGYSFAEDKPVADVIGERMFLTFVLNFFTILFIYIVAFPIGVYSAVRQYSVGDYGLTFIGYLGLATPNFLLALILLYVAKSQFGVDVGGLMDEEYIGQPWSIGKAVSVLEHLIVPVIVIGTSGTAAMIRRLRANLLDELHKQYVITAKAKGLPPGKALRKYPLRMSLNPFIADIGNLIPDVVSGSAIVSVVLGLPTTGPMLLNSLINQDIYLAGSFLMFVAFLTVVGMLVSDLALALLDPRIRLGAEASK
ncbi:ABC transporter permease [Aestuariispira insulae]|uniref:Peptide/nickel transport system permease protein n=1 Tax=Aestuariispira insulae TaxID=1461337 RepID=A0A3D9HPC4_9PROT|nr:ABC transporter permease [Aestuariispira insulae]RED51337.1 peptide/nickel transport system permease protein [Aestuariispira insulae]